MKRILIILCALIIPSAFAQGGPLESLKAYSDGYPRTPSFIPRHIHGKCGDLDLTANTMTGNVQGHVISFRYDRLGGIATFAVDGATTVAFVDAAGNVTEIQDDKGVVTPALRLTHSQAAAAAARQHDQVARILDECAPLVTTKDCVLDGLSFATPSNTDPSNDTNAAAGTAQLKSCSGDPYSEDFWIATLAPDFDSSGPDPNAVNCQQAKDACNTTCDAAFGLGGVACLAIGGRSVPVGVVCAMADYLLWQNCKQDCAAQFPC